MFLGQAIRQIGGMLELYTVQEAYLNNADWFAEQSTAKCKAFVTACHQLLVLLPTMSKRGDAGEMQWSIEAIEKQLAAAKSRLSTRLDDSARSRTRFADFRDYRQ